MKMGQSLFKTCLKYNFMKIIPIQNNVWLTCIERNKNIFGEKGNLPLKVGSYGGNFNCGEIMSWAHIH